MHKEIVHTILENENGLELKAVLSHCLGFSRHEISRLKFMTNGILVNGQKERVTYLCKTGDILKCTFMEEEKEAVHSTYIPDILYEDEDMVIVNKPAGMPVHPSHKHLQDSLGSALVAYYQAKNQAFTIRSIGRLDKDVSGVMVYAKNQPSAARLSVQRKKGILKKTYVAIISGTLKDKEGILTYSLEKDASMKRQKSGAGKHCVTEYKVLEEKAEYSLLEIHLVTGRTHQIRAGFASLGYPLLGDALYDGDCSNIARPALHCKSIECFSPFTQKKIKIEIALPEDIKKLL